VSFLAIDATTIENRAFFGGQNNLWWFIFGRRKLWQNPLKIDGPSKIIIIFGSFAGWTAQNGWAAENRSNFWWFCQLGCRK
jgi:hypothetical protein